MVFLYFEHIELSRSFSSYAAFLQPHNRAIARRIQNMGWRADGDLWLLVRGGGLFLSKGTGVIKLNIFSDYVLVCHIICFKTVIAS